MGKYIEIWKARKENENIEKKEKMAEEEKMNNVRKLQIMTVLFEYGLSSDEVETNGYSYKFEYNNLFVNFVDQRNRLCGEIYKKPTTKDEEECIRDAHSILYSSNEKEKKLFQKEFNYRSFVLYGHPNSTIEKVMNIAEMDINKVRKLQDSQGTINNETDSLEKKLSK